MRPTFCPKCGARDIKVTRHWEPAGTQYYIECPSPQAGGPDHTSTVEVAKHEPLGKPVDSPTSPGSAEREVHSHRANHGPTMQMTAPNSAPSTGLGVKPVATLAAAATTPAPSTAALVDEMKAPGGFHTAEGDHEEGRECFSRPLS